MKVMKKKRLMFLALVMMFMILRQTAMIHA